ncbi:hypothetical protein Ocin01_15031 [Orchesella cincta]|uniref:Uncharacterized protein n=1 Tax=Orchesella cincta TaxID=48709 RepID=A0A1D2MF92_ORCCI|nr:hypothetical protein Ocin01_15031 [Orchesella cincta]
MYRQHADQAVLLKFDCTDLPHPPDGVIRPLLETIYFVPVLNTKNGKAKTFSWLYLKLSLEIPEKGFTSCTLIQLANHHQQLA